MCSTFFIWIFSNVKWNVNQLFIFVESRNQFNSVRYLTNFLKLDFRVNEALDEEKFIFPLRLIFHMSIAWCIRVVRCIFCLYNAYFVIQWDMLSTFQSPTSEFIFYFKFNYYKSFSVKLIINLRIFVEVRK